MKILMMILALILGSIAAIPASADSRPLVQMDGQFVREGATISIKGMMHKPKFSFRNGAVVDLVDGEMVVYRSPNNRRTLLTVQNELPLPNTPNQEWLGYARTPPMNMTTFTADWIIPEPPITYDSDETLFYFTGITHTDDLGSTVIQPVIEWNTADGVGQWLARSWVVGPSCVYRGEAVPCLPGDKIFGIMKKNAGSMFGNIWVIRTINDRTKQESIIFATETIIPFTNASAWCTLESAYGYVDDVDELPGPCTFNNIRLMNGNAGIYTSWLLISKIDYVAVSNSGSLVKIGRTSPIIIPDLPGDVNGDCHVNISDLIILASSFSKCQGSPGWDDRADLNDSGCVDFPDLIILASNYGASC